MKGMSANLKYFSILALVISMIFFNYLFSAIKSQAFDNIWLFATLYGLVLFAAGLAFGYKDPVQNSRADLGFHYHFMTYIIVNITGVFWLFKSMGFSTENLLGATFQCLFWGLGLFVHYYFSSKSIKGIDRGKVFD